MADQRISKLEKAIEAFPDFPKKGILFRDVFSVLRDPELFKSLTDLLVEHVRKTINESGKQVHAIVGLEARGFLFGPIMAQALDCSFVPVRKSGKLPGETEKISYAKEYGEDTFEVQKGSVQQGQNVVIVDDLLATGGTMSAAYQLMQKIQANVVDCIVVIELEDLKGRAKVPGKCTSLIKY